MAFSHPYSPVENHWAPELLHNEQVQAEENDVARNKIPDLFNYINGDEETLEDAFSMPQPGKPDYGTPEVNQQVQENNMGAYGTPVLEFSMDLLKPAPVTQPEDDPTPIQLSLSPRDFTGGPAHQWNKYSMQHELQLDREMNIKLGDGVVGGGKGDFVELRMVHATAGFGHLYRVTPTGGQTDKGE